MRKLILAVLMLGVVGVAQSADIPNLEASILYDFQVGQLVTGLTSKIISVGDVDLRVGYTTSNDGVVSLSYDLRNIEKWGPHINYLWDSMATSLGLWAGYNFKDERWGYGISVVMVAITFD